MFSRICKGEHNDRILVSGKEVEIEMMTYEEEEVVEL